MKSLVIMKTKPLAIQVCTTLSPENAAAELEAIRPCGTVNGWCFDEEQGIFECADDSRRTHIVFVA